MPDAVYTICSDLAARVNAEVARLLIEAARQLESPRAISQKEIARSTSMANLPDGSVEYRYRGTPVVRVFSGLRPDGKFSIKVGSLLAKPD